MRTPVGKKEFQHEAHGKDLDGLRPRTICRDAHAAELNCTESSCTQTRTLGSDVTVEFRGKCNGYTPKHQTCQAQAGKMTCTVAVAFTDYMSCTCTNWGVWTKKAKVHISC